MISGLSKDYRNYLKKLKKKDLLLYSNHLSGIKELHAK